MHARYATIRMLASLLNFLVRITFLTWFLYFSRFSFLSSVYQHYIAYFHLVGSVHS